MSHLSLDQCNVLQTEQFQEALANGEFWPNEFQKDVNRISRATIRAFKRQFGDAWLGKINLYNEWDYQHVLIQYKSGMIYNFSCCFIVPRYDKKLVRLILDRKDAYYEGTRIDSLRINAIFNRIEQLGGQNLHWV